MDCYVFEGVVVDFVRVIFGIDELVGFILDMDIGCIIIGVWEVVWIIKIDVDVEFGFILVGFVWDVGLDEF